jgi:hypothetical protein
MRPLALWAVAIAIACAGVAGQNVNVNELSAVQLGTALANPDAAQLLQQEAGRQGSVGSWRGRCTHGPASMSDPTLMHRAAAGWPLSSGRRRCPSTPSAPTQTSPT